MFLKRSCIGYRLDRGVEGIGKDGGKFSDDAVRIDVGGWACAMYTCTTHDSLVSTSSSSRQSNSGHLVRSGSSVIAVHWCASAYLFEPNTRYRYRIVFYVKSKIPVISSLKNAPAGAHAS